MEERISVKIPYNPECIAAIKQVPTRKWDPEKKEWSVVRAYLQDIVTAIRPYYLGIADSLLEKYGKPHKTASLLSHEEMYSQDKKLITNVLERLEAIKVSDIEPYPYQKLGIAFIEKNQGKAFITDEMGLGKTLISLLWCSINFPKVFPILVICPASLKTSERPTHRL